MRFFDRKIVRVICFLIVFAIIVTGTEFILLKTDGTTLLTMHDYQRAPSDIDLLFIGNSLCRCDVDPEIVDSHMGLYSFNLSKESIKFDGLAALLRAELPQKHVKHVVLIVDPYQIFDPPEEPIVLAALVPYLSDPINRWAYVLNTSVQFGDVLDRCFPWRMFYEEQPGAIIDNIRAKLSEDSNYQEKRKHYDDMGDRHYGGKGFGAHNMPVDQESIEEAVSGWSPLTFEEAQYASFRDKLRTICSLCSDRGCTFTAVIPPHLLEIAKENPNYRLAFNAIERACRELNVDCLNFTYARPAFYSNDLSPFYYDGKCHLNEEGADIFSALLAEVLDDYYQGKDISKYFYSEEEFFAVKGN